MKTKIALMAAVMAFSYTFAQENPHMKLYSQKIDSIVVSEKSKLDTELNEIDKNFTENKISAEEKQKQRLEIASKYEQIINEKVNAQQSELEDATKSMVKNAVLGKKDTLQSGKNELALELGGMKIKFNKDKKTPKDYLKNIELSVSLTGTNLTSKDQPFKFLNKDSDIRNTVFNSSSFTLRYESQVGGFTSPVFYRLGFGFRADNYVPKYGKVFAQDNNSLFIKDFDRGNLRRTYMTNNYISVPLDLKFVLNPEYIDFNGVKYLDNNKKQFTLVAGIYGGLRVGSVMYNKFSNENSKRIVEKERVMQGVNNFIFGGKFGIGYAGFNLFIQKDFTPLFNNDAKLNKKYGLQIGIEVGSINF